MSRLRLLGKSTTEVSLRRKASSISFDLEDDMTKPSKSSIFSRTPPFFRCNVLFKCSRHKEGPSQHRDSLNILPANKAEVQQWGERIRNSDSEAYKELFRYCQKPLLRYAQGFVGVDDSYDILQDVFIKLWDKREGLDCKKSLESLLYTMVRNACLNMLRKTKTAELDDDMPRSSSMMEPQEELVATELASRINRWVSELPLRRREAFVLSRSHGLSHKEIAIVMGLSEKTVNAHILLVLQTLRRKLDIWQTKSKPREVPNE